MPRSSPSRPLGHAAASRTFLDHIIPRSIVRRWQQRNHCKCGFSCFLAPCLDLGGQGERLIDIIVRSLPLSQGDSIVMSIVALGNIAALQTSATVLSRASMCWRSTPNTSAAFILHCYCCVRFFSAAVLYLGVGRRTLAGPVASIASARSAHALPGSPSSSLIACNRRDPSSSPRETSTPS